MNKAVRVKIVFIILNILLLLAIFEFGTLFMFRYTRCFPSNIISYITHAHTFKTPEKEIKLPSGYYSSKYPREYKMTTLFTAANIKAEVVLYYVGIGDFEDSLTIEHWESLKHRLVDSNKFKSAKVISLYKFNGNDILIERSIELENPLGDYSCAYNALIPGKCREIYWFSWTTDLKYFLTLVKNTVFQDVSGEFELIKVFPYNEEVN